MAALFSAKDGSLQSNNEGLSCEYEKGSAQEVNIDPVSNSKARNAKNTDGEMEISPGGSALKNQDHAEVVAASAALPQIKVEQAEEDECVIVHIEEVDEEDFAVMSKGDSPDREESAEGEWPFRCEDCSEAFGNKEDYLEHRSEHIHDGPIVCLDTDSQWDDLLISTDGGRRTLFCGLCGQKFSSSKGFFTHQMKHRNQVIKQGTRDGFGEGSARQKLFECKDCGKAYSTVGQCLNHQRSHKQASKSVFHQLAHLKKKSFQCPTCGRCYSRASALDAHRRCHEVKLVKSKNSETVKAQLTNEAPDQAESNEAISEQTEEQEQKVFQCFCGKSFRTMCGLGTHQRFSTSCSEGRVKEEVKHPFVCSECDKTFVSSVALVCHQRWHKRRAQLVCNKPYKCTECGKAFTSLTFYDKHQRLAHSEELPSKSFLHQVIQVKKKSFECQECGRRFSRASALQSHQLCHTDVFCDVMEKRSQMSTVSQTVKIYENDSADTAVYHSQDLLHAPVQEKDCIDTVDELEVVGADYEVVRITALNDFENQSALSQDQNPDLELVCESDQEEKDDSGFDSNQAVESTSSLQMNPDIDVKIVQIDYEPVNDETLINSEVMSKSCPQEAKYNCPHCDRKFVKAMSLRCHILWHKGCMGKKSDGRQKFDILSPTKKVLLTCEVCGFESPSKSAHYFHIRKHEDKVPYKSISYQLENLQKNNIKCEECGMCFSRLSALHSHQQHHNRRKKKPFACLQCDRSYVTASGLYNHSKICSGGAKDEMTKHYNPTKSLLGPKVHHCKKCGKGFWSMGAFDHHKQNHSECADVETRPAGSSNAENGRIRRKRKGRRAGFRKVQPINSKEEHKCDVCGKSYHMLACFLKHKLVHNQGLQPAVKSFDYQVQQLKKNSYQCPDCMKVFSRAMALQFHMKSHGFETGLPLDWTERPQCPTCYAFFASESILQNHQKHCSNPEDSVEFAQECAEGGKEEEEASSQRDVGEASHSTDSSKEQKAPVAPELKYKCKDCSRSFSVIGALNFHKRIHRKGYRTKKLKSDPPKPLKLVKVKQEKCLTKTPFVCVECERYFGTNSALGTHRRWHRDKKFARFLSKTNKIRSKKSLDGGPYLCNKCGKGFFYLCVLRRHQLHHPPMENQLQKEQEVAESNDVFTCPDCHMSFKSGSLLTTHFADNHSKPTETENLQSENLYPDELGPSTKRDITKQEKTKVQHYQCPHCPKSFLNIRGLRAHKWQKHHNVSKQAASAKKSPVDAKSRKLPNKKEPKPSTEEEPVQRSRNVEFIKCFFKCNKCAKTFPSEEQLSAHREVANTRPHCCALCCRGYWTENQLQQHLAWHNEVRRRLPTELRYRLSASVAPGPSDNLQAEPVVKLPVALVSSQTNSHKCQDCGKTFLSPRALQQHQVLHQTKAPYNCSLCSRVFSDIKNLIDHHQECLGDKEGKDSSSAPAVRGAVNLTCTECGTTFKQETELHQHYIEHARGL